MRSRTDFAPYRPSTDYDVLLDDGVRLPPKAVFGRAAAIALSIDVQPKHFTGGRDTPCFKAIKDAGFEIVSKTGSVSRAQIPPSEDEQWSEGSANLVLHFRKERAGGLARAKKSAFKAAHGGRLFCEACQLEPVLEYGDPLADACIEVHHSQTAVASMMEGHLTRLSDLQCLCANCHRLVHARLRAEAVGPLDRQ